MFDAFSKNPNLDKKSKEFIESLSSKISKPIYEMKPEEARLFLLDLQKETHRNIPAEVRDIDIFTDLAGSVSVRLIRPENYNEILPVILYFHGGGWILGDKETHDMLIRRLAVGTNSVVAFVNYTRAPESVYPAQINQGYGVLEYLYQNPEEFGIDPDRIIIAGDSAGGNLATAIALKSLKEGGPKILYQLLLYPVTDADMNSESYKLFKDGPWLSKKAMEWFWNAYLDNKTLKDEIYVSPLKASLSDLSGMPPALIVTGENDVLRDEGEAYACKLEEAGVEVYNVRVNMTIHDFLMLNVLQSSELVNDTFSLICNILSNKFRR